METEIILIACVVVTFIITLFILKGERKNEFREN